MEEVLEEGLVGELGGVSVGVANVWEREYVDGVGRARRGLAARLDWVADGVEHRVFAGEGAHVECGGGRWLVTSVVKSEGSRGRIALRRMAPA